MRFNKLIEKFSILLTIALKEGYSPFLKATIFAFRHRNLDQSRRYLLGCYYKSIAAKGELDHFATPIEEIETKLARGSTSFMIWIGLVEHIGDIVATEPIPRYLKSKYPNVQIAWITKPIYRELVAHHPAIDLVIEVACLTDWIRMVAHNKEHVVVDLHMNGRICQECKIPLEKKYSNELVNAENYFSFGSILESFSLGAGLTPIKDQPKIYIPAHVKERVNQFFLEEKTVVFHCVSQMVEKNWSHENWEKLADWITTHTDLTVVEVGERAVLQEKKSRRNLCGKLTLLESSEVISRSLFFIGVDSGPAHMANACNLPGLILLGKFKEFDFYNPFTGLYGDESSHSIVRNISGPASELTYESVLDSVARKLSVSKKNDLLEQPLSIQPKEEAKKIQLIAFYLPQYHPIPLNDLHWGTGFTEWRNVTKATPFFKGHYQPRHPADFGHYDLRVPEVLEQQALLAKNYGIDAFCYYLYWFQGQRLLHAPIDRMLETKKPDFPFCFCWANENWTRRWDGNDKEIMIAQAHSPEDDLRFIHHLFPAFDDSRYLRVDGKPLLLIYRTELFPDPIQTAERWRTEAMKAGFKGLYLVRCQGFDTVTSPEDIGFDASYEVPTFHLTPEVFFKNLEQLNVDPDFKGRIFDYEKIVDFHHYRKDVSYKRFKSVMLAWDNTARHGKNGTIFHGVTPELYKKWLRNCLQYTNNRFRNEEKMVFINAWNEWAEGTYLEPDLVFGRAFLEATKSALQEIE